MLYSPDTFVDNPVTVANFPATQPVSGPLTDAQLRATPVPISGTVTTTASTGSTATIAQVSVTNAASIVLLAANANRKKAILFIPTIGTKLYIGLVPTTSLTAFTWIVSANNTTLEVNNYTGVISAIATGATDLVNVTEVV